MKCIHCGKNVDDEARFCKYCGTRLRRTCAKCGAGLDDDARFCAACGAEALAELDLTNPLADLSAADKIAASGQTNPLGFYFSRRISRLPRRMEKMEAESVEQRTAPRRMHPINVAPMPPILGPRTK